MSSFLTHKNILLGVTGSIAAYKSAELARLLRKAGANVRVAMTENAKRFITPLTLQAVSGFPIHDDLFDVAAEAAMGHIELARWADLVLIAPATADCMARLARGQANDLLSTVCAATQARVALAPAMNQAMWRDVGTQDNMQVLQQRSVFILGPATGSQACGDVGPGRMLEPVQIVEEINGLFATGLLAGVRVLVTAGPTREAIDPVRFIGNYSSGKMGYALAEAAQEAGAIVTLVSGPVALPTPSHQACLYVESAQEMHDVVMKNAPTCDIFLAVAAVGDYRVASILPHKMHKTEEAFTLNLERTTDIVSAVGQLPNRPFIVGFAAETQDLIAQSHAKRQRKKMDLIIANHIGKELVMGADDNEVTVLGLAQDIALARMPKQKLARQLIELIAMAFKEQSTT